MADHVHGKAGAKAPAELADSPDPVAGGESSARGGTPRDSCTGALPNQLYDHNILPEFQHNEQPQHHISTALAHAR